MILVRLLGLIQIAEVFTPQRSAAERAFRFLDELSPLLPPLIYLQYTYTMLILILRAQQTSRSALYSVVLIH